MKKLFLLAGLLFMVSGASGAERKPEPTPSLSAAEVAQLEKSRGDSADFAGTRSTASQS